MKTDELMGALLTQTPQQKASVLVKALHQVFLELEEEERRQLLIDLTADDSQDKISSMVHLWLAECLGEGVDPTKMCQSLVTKIAQSEQLQAVAAPEVLVLFEDWMEELEREILTYIDEQDRFDPLILAEELGLSRSGAQFLISKLEKEGKI